MNSKQQLLHLIREQLSKVNLFAGSVNASGMIDLEFYKSLFVGGKHEIKQPRERSAFRDRNYPELNDKRKAKLHQVTYLPEAFFDLLGGGELHFFQGNKVVKVDSVQVKLLRQQTTSYKREGISGAKFSNNVQPAKVIGNTLKTSVQYIIVIKLWYTNGGVGSATSSSNASSSSNYFSKENEAVRARRLRTIRSQMHKNNQEAINKGIEQNNQLFDVAKEKQNQLLVMLQNSNVAQRNTGKMEAEESSCGLIETEVDVGDDKIMVGSCVRDTTPYYRSRILKKKKKPHLVIDLTGEEDQKAKHRRMITEAINTTLRNKPDSVKQSLLEIWQVCYADSKC